MPVSMFFTEMEAPGRTAPVASLTVPSKVPRNVCAVRIVAEDRVIKTNENARSRQTVRIASPFRRVLLARQQKCTTSVRLRFDDRGFQRLCEFVRQQGERRLPDHSAHARLNPAVALW